MATKDDLDKIYEHRSLLFIALAFQYMKEKPGSALWKPDPEDKDWFLLYLTLPSGQISYHLPNKFLPTVSKRIRDGRGDIWDGHSSEDVSIRLKAFVAQSF